VDYEAVWNGGVREKPSVFQTKLKCL